MLDPKLAAAATDAALSPEARSVVFYVASLSSGPHEIPHREFARLLGRPGEKRLRAAIQDAVDLGYLTRTAGGRAHHDRYEFTPAQDADLSVSPAAGADVSADKVAAGADVKRPSSPPTSPPSPDARVREDDIYVERLRVWLGGQRGVIERFADSAKHGPHWARDIWASYRAPSGEPGDGGGTEWAALFAGEDEETAVRAVVNAMQDYAGEGKPFDLKLFRGFVRSSMREIRKADRVAMETPLAKTGTDAPDRWPTKRGPQPHDAQEYKPTGFRGFNG